MRRREFLQMIPAGVAVGAGATTQASVLDDLFANRLMFDAAGSPLVAVRMMEGRSSTELVAASGLDVEVLSDDLQFQVPGGSTLRIERRSGRPARIDERWVLETLEREQRTARREAVARWGSKGVQVQLLSVGGVYGMSGTVIDTRATLVTLPVTSREPDWGQLGTRGTRVELLSSMPTLVSEWFIDDRKMGKTGSRARPAVIRVRPTAGDSLLVRKVEHSVGYAKHGFADRELRGETLVVPDRNGRLAVVNVVPEDILVAGILPSEMFATAPLEALKAQAVTARGELFAKIGRRHLADPYLVCSEQHCQVYQGRSAEHPRTTQAAAETRGELAFQGGFLVDSVYSACCGGHTEPAHIVWDRPPNSALLGEIDAPLSAALRRRREIPSPWRAALDEGQHGGVLAGTTTPSASPVPYDLRDDEMVRRFLSLPRTATFCGRSSFNQRGDAYRWQRRFDQEQLQRLTEDLQIGEVTQVQIPERGPGGRLKRFLIVGTRGRVQIDRELPVRRRFQNLRSGLFVVDEERDDEQRLIAVTFRGAGFGHGSGMCQQGAIGMAESGYRYEEILGHYYNGARVRKVF